LSWIWSAKRETNSNRRNAAQYVSNIGCDSAAAWSKKYRHLAKKYTVDSLIEHIESLVPKYAYERPDIVITGGEPLLPKFQKFWVEFLKKTPNFSEITFETNGTQRLSTDLFEAITNGNIRFTFSVSPKLEISGEPQSKMLKPEAVTSYRMLYAFDWSETGHNVYLKFVIRDNDDVEEVYHFINEYQKDYKEELSLKTCEKPTVYLMPEGATIEGLKLTETQVANIALENGFRYSPRLHCSLFGNSWGT